MNSYPRDEFDDVPEDSARRGAYRGQQIDQSTSRGGTIAILCVGILGLLLGAVMFVVQPRTLAPDAPNNVSAAVSAPASESSNESQQTPKDPSEINVKIYNAGTYPGAASEVEREMKKAGYNVTGTSNWKGESIPYSMVYYANGFIAEANTVADGLGFSYFEEQKDAPADIAVVLGPDFAGIPEGSFQENVAAQETATASATASETPAP